LRRIRAADWWSYKIPPLLVTAYAGLLLYGARGAEAATVALAIAAIVMVAVYGYVLNDLTDLEADRLAERPNRMAGTGTPLRALLLVGAAGAALTLGWFTHDPVLLALIAGNLLLPTLYSVPPVRLKGRGVLGGLADAAGVHAVPMAIVARAVTLGVEADPSVVLFLASAIVWAALAGLRGIIVHQVADLQADRVAQVRTFAAHMGVARARTLVLHRLLPLELAALGVFLLLVLPAAAVAAVVVICYVGVEWRKVRREWILPVFEPADRSRERYLPMINNELYEVWLPLGLVIQLALGSPILWLLAAAHLTLFWPNTAARWHVAVRALRAPKRRTPYDVVVGTTTWTVNGVNVFSLNLVRGLCETGVDAHVLLTEQETDLVTSRERPMPAPDGVPFRLLPVGRTDGWGMHWGAMLRYLEESSPCIYIPNSDWRHSCIVPLLSDNVIVVGVVHSDDPLHYDHVRRLGRYWNAVVAVSDTVAARAAAHCPDIAGRIVTIPIGVRIPAERPLRPLGGDRLRVVYHGILKQHQKRVFDLPRIAQAAVDLGVPIELTIVGAGPDETSLRDAAQPLVERGVIRFTGAVSPDAIPAIVESNEVYLLASEFEGMPNALIEAMGRGCVPVVSDMESGIPELVRDGVNGFLAPIGDADAFAARLKSLHDDPALRDRLAAEAYRTAATGPFRLEDMVARYGEVFDRAWQEARSGRFTRPRAPLDHPPAVVAGVSLFPVGLDHDEPELGAFPSPDDAEEFRDQLDATVPGARRPTPQRAYRPGTASGWPSLRAVPVFVSAPVWTAHGVNHHAEDLVRCLGAHGMDARLLLTEESTALVTIDQPRMARPTDITIEELTLRRGENWGARWGALVRRLEAAAPCIYLPGYDWRHAAAVPLLSRRVVVVGTIPEVNPLYFEQAARLLGRWDGMVAGSRDVARHLRRDVPGLRDRLVTIPHGVEVPADPIERADDGKPVSIVVIGDGGPMAHEGVVVLASSFREQAGSGVLTMVDPGESAWSTGLPIRVDSLTRPNRQQWLAACRHADVVVALDDRHDTRRRLIEAMGHGALPVAIGAGDVGGLIRHGESGFLGPSGMAPADAAAIVASWRDPVARRRLLHAAHQAARASDYRADQMAVAYLDLFARLLHGSRRAARPGRRLPLCPPPASVDGIGVFEVPLPCHTSVGPFPSEDDVRAFTRQSGIRATRHRATR
jgi:glycosyltransferase involved in cell wall biosynthesis